MLTAGRASNFVMAVQAMSKTPGGGARKRFRQQWPIFEFRVAQRNGPSREKSQVLTSEQTDGNRDGTVPLVNPITTGPRLVASQAGLFHCPNFKSRVSEDHLSKARLCRALLSVVIPQRCR